MAPLPESRHPERRPEVRAVRCRGKACWPWRCWSPRWWRSLHLVAAVRDERQEGRRRRIEARRRPPCGRGRRRAQARTPSLRQAPSFSRWIRDPHPSPRPAADEETAEPIGVRRTGPARRPRVAQSQSLLRTHPSSSCPAGPAAAAGNAHPPWRAGGGLGREQRDNGHQRSSRGTRRQPGRLSQPVRRARSTRCPREPPQQQQPARERVPRPSGVTPGCPLPGGLRALRRPLRRAPSSEGNCRPRQRRAWRRRRSETRADLAQGNGLHLRALKTKVISATSGFVGCQVLHSDFGRNGRVRPLIERGSHLDGEYRVASFRSGRSASRCRGRDSGRLTA